MTNRTLLPTWFVKRCQLRQYQRRYLIVHYGQIPDVSGAVLRSYGRPRSGQLRRGTSLALAWLCHYADFGLRFRSLWTTRLYGLFA